MKTLSTPYILTAEQLPPEGVDVEAKQFADSKPEVMQRFGTVWEKNWATPTGGFRVTVNYVPVAWRGME